MTTAELGVCQPKIRANILSEFLQLNKINQNCYSYIRFISFYKHIYTLSSTVFRIRIRFVSWIRIRKKNAGPDPAARDFFPRAKSQGFYWNKSSKIDTEKDMAQLAKYVENRDFRL